MGSGDGAKHLTRRKLLQAGAAGAVGAGVATVTGAPPAGAGSAESTGIHIHGSLQGGTKPLLNGRIIHVTVHGPDDNLGGIGIDADPETTGSMRVKRHDRTQCVYDVHGSVEGDVVRLTGNFLLWHGPENDTLPVEIEANLATGAIKWTATLDGAGPVPFNGTGVVIRI